MSYDFITDLNRLKCSLLETPVCTQLCALRAGNNTRL